MTTSSKTETDSGPPSAEWIEKTVSDTFDEFLDAISAKGTFHKSERHDPDTSPTGQSTSVKIYDIINFYHSFCQLCEQHFYTRSVAGDINSFFQNHMNTSYHRQVRMVEVLPDDVPMFTWEEKFVTGKCNVCNMPGLNTYIMDTGFDPMKLMRQHVCVWDKENRETNERVLRKLNLLKTYCRLKIFRKKFIKTLDERAVCLLCGVKLPWTEEKAWCHLSSDGHYQKFCLFLRKCFNFSPKDVLNGFNLEVVTRALITRDPPPITTFVECDEEAKCREESNNGENPYPEERVNFSFSPKQLGESLRNEETDLIQGNECLLCGVEAVPEHMKSGSHREKAKNLKEDAFESVSKYAEYRTNLAKRVHRLENLKKLELGEEDRPAKAPSPKEQSQKSNTQVMYFKRLLREKLDSVKAVYTVVSEQQKFCEVCDEIVPNAQVVQHVTTTRHKFHESRWEALEKNFENKKFLETFQKIKDTILCLLCGAVIHPNNFYSHVKGELHKHKFEWYSRQDVSVPISSTFYFRKDFSCVCKICNSLINGRVSLPSLKMTLKNAMLHWPCPRVKEREKNLREERGATEKGKRESGRRRSSTEDAREEETGGRGKDSGTKGHRVDFKKVAKTVECVVNVFEQKIVKEVVERSAAIGQLDIRSGGSRKERSSAVGKQPSCGCDDGSKCSCAATATATTTTAVREKKEVEEKVNKVRRNELRGEKTENNRRNHLEEEEEDKDDGGEEEEEEEQKMEEEHEVLVIDGLPRIKRSSEFIYSIFHVFGKIRYVFFEKKLVILAFTEAGVAEKAAEGETHINGHKVKLTVSKRKVCLKPGEQKLPPLNKDLVPLLENPQKLLDFVVNLIMQAVAMSQSPVERKREELVCSTIISAIYEAFPQGRCYPFGSRLSGLTLNNSDLDVFLDCGGMYEGFKNTTAAKERKLVNRVAGLLRKKREIADIIVVDRARVPIISFLHKPTLMYCDVSFKNGLSIQNTLLIKFMTSLDWRVRPLILFLKLWAKLNGLQGPPNFSSYAIAMLVIFYLEQLECPVLPTIESLQNDCVGPRTTIGGWDCSINMNPAKLPQSENKVPFPQLLAGLFEFYAGFDYDSNVISPLTGKPLPRKAFSSEGVATLPMCYKRHVLNIPPPIENLVSSKFPVCIIDPFDVSHVLTKSFTSRSLKIFTHLCRESERHLQKGIVVVGSSQP